MQRQMQTYYYTSVPNAAWIDSRQYYAGYRPEIYSNYGSASTPGPIYPFERPFTNNCTLLNGCFKADPVTKKGLRYCNLSCDDPKQINQLRYMYGSPWQNNRS
jgi:hypothetical protein